MLCANLKATQSFNDKIQCFTEHGTIKISFAPASNSARRFVASVYDKFLLALSVFKYAVIRRVLLFIFISNALLSFLSASFTTCTHYTPVGFELFCRTIASASSFRTLANAVHSCDGYSRLYTCANCSVSYKRWLCAVSVGCLTSARVGFIMFSHVVLISVSSSSSSCSSSSFSSSSV